MATKGTVAHRRPAQIGEPSTHSVLGFLCPESQRTCKGTDSKGRKDFLLSCPHPGNPDLNKPPLYTQLLKKETRASFIFSHPPLSSPSPTDFTMEAGVLISTGLIFWNTWAKLALFYTATEGNK